MTDRRGGVLVAVGLKLYLTPAESAAWAGRVAALVRERPAVAEGRVEVAVLPTLPALAGVRDALAGTGVALGAQDLDPFDRGAYTGGVSGADLREAGCRYAEAGHAERRRHFGEDDALIGAKVAAAARNGLVPLLCVGERDRGGSGAALDEVRGRLDAVLGAAGDGVGDLVVAYEPEWAIGVAAAADPAHIAAVCGGVRDHLDARGGRGTLRVLYGGSAGPGLLPALGGAVDGLFLGRSAHDTAALARVVDEAADTARPAERPVSPAGPARAARRPRGR